MHRQPPPCSGIGYGGADERKRSSRGEQGDGVSNGSLLRHTITRCFIDSVGVTFSLPIYMPISAEEMFISICITKSITIFGYRLC